MLMTTCSRLDGMITCSREVELGRREPMLREALAKVAAIDLSMVKRKLMDPEEGLGWSADYADHVEVRYRRYLVMVCVNGQGANVPTMDIDQFWHQHILDTRAYARDCESAFGEFLHHFPYFGMRGEVDARNLAASFELTKATYCRLFGEDYCIEYGSNLSRCHKCSDGGGVKCHKCSD
jgi:hypothetical protein